MTSLKEKMNSMESLKDFSNITFDIDTLGKMRVPLDNKEWIWMYSHEDKEKDYRAHLEVEKF